MKDFINGHPYLFTFFVVPSLASAAVGLAAALVAPLVATREKREPSKL